MLMKRIIPCLDVDQGRVVKGVRYVDHVDAGDPVEVARRYDEQEADELTFLDITASHEARRIMLDVAERTAKTVFMPVCIGGGVRTLQDIRDLLNAGADKVSIMTAAVEDPELVGEAALKIGSANLVVAIDARRIDDRAAFEARAAQRTARNFAAANTGAVENAGVEANTGAPANAAGAASDAADASDDAAASGAAAASETAGASGAADASDAADAPPLFEVYTHGGRRGTGLCAVAFARAAAKAGAGEILLTSMDRDGTRSGYDLELVRSVADAAPLPVIASGGGGTPESLAEALSDAPQGGHAQAALAASIFHFGDETVASVKRRLLELGIPVRAPRE